MIILSNIPTLPPKHSDKKEIKEKTEGLVKRLGELQNMLQAQGKYGILVILQGMDGSGKDGATENVFKECHPTGMRAISFKKPSEEEFSHDFLWRVHKNTPPKGMIHIFNRSHYEDILIQRVHQWIDDEHAMKRMQAINAFETLLQFDANTLIFKFYLHISFDQQGKELQERIDSPEKNWKYNLNDWKERDFWAQYMHCYEYAINQSTIPWTIVPVDERWYRDYIIASTLVEQLEKLDIRYPALEVPKNK